MLISTTTRSLAACLLAASLAWAAPPASRSAEATHKSMAAALKQAMAGQCLTSARAGLLVRDLETGKDVYASLADEAFIPASNMKVLTTAAVLSRLRPERTFRTGVLTAGKVRDGVVQGDLYLLGGGDPGLVPESLYLLATRLQAQGIRRIEGDLVGDDTLFDAKLRPQGWPERNFHRAFSAPHSALTVAYSSVSIRIRPTQPGRPVEVEVMPFPSFFDVEVTATTSRKSKTLKVERTWEGGRNVLRISGYHPIGHGEVELVRSVESPTFYALEGFHEILGQVGIEVKGELRSDTVPETATEIAFYTSRPLYQLVLDVNKYSSNIMAEMLLKNLSVEAQGPPGTTLGGAQEVLTWLGEIGAPTDGITILDGSGLSEQSRLTPRTLVSALDHVWQDYEIRPEFLVSLPVAGSDGTLRKRLNGIGRRVRAKTGLVRGAVTLSGYAYGPDDRPYAFSLLVNDHKCPAWRVQKDMDRVVLAIVRGGV